MDPKRIVDDVKALLRTAGYKDIAYHADDDEAMVTALGDGTSSVVFRWARVSGRPPITSGGGPRHSPSALDVGVVPAIVGMDDHGKTDEHVARAFEQMTVELANGRMRMRSTAGHGSMNPGDIEFNPQ
jgi:hypothetical protein